MQRSPTCSTVTPAKLDSQSKVILSSVEFLLNHFFFFAEGRSADPRLNSQLKGMVEEALRKKMPNSTIQNILKKYSDPSASKLSKYFVDIKALNKVYMVGVLCTENVAGAKQIMASYLKKFK